MAQDTLTSKVELSISCKNLRDMDILSKSDPMAVLFQKLNDSYFEVGRTEVIKNNLNPVFAKMFEINYRFEERQLFKVEIYDSDSSSMNLNAHDFLGRYEFSLGEIVSRKKFETQLKNCGTVSKKAPALITLSCQQLSSCKESLTLQFTGTKLDKKDVFGKSDPLLEVYRCNELIHFSKDQSNMNINSNFSLVYRSKPIMNTLNPSWPAFNVKLTSLCCGDKDRLIKFVCADWNNNGSQDFIGQCFSSVNHLLSSKGSSQAFELINFHKQAKKKSYKNSGTMTLCRADVQIDHTFIDFISGGTELNFTVSIDFTASNGNPKDAWSLHYIPQGGYAAENQYETAISAVGSIIQDYDSDKMFPALGFGARIPPNNDISHCFPINFCLENPYCSGVNGLVTAYRSAIRAVRLHGPTNFSPCIRHVQKFAQAHRDGSKYFVLLIITDGIITDLDATVDAIVDCSYLPMSIIIIGVGEEDFSTMDILDCDNGRLRSGQKVAERDIVQFVAIRDFQKNSNSTINHAALNKAVLFELPGQVTTWMRANRISPLPPQVNNVANFTHGDPSQQPLNAPMTNAPPHGGPYPPMTNAPPHGGPYPPMGNAPQHGGPYPPMGNAAPHGGSYPPMANAPQHGGPYPPMANTPQHGGQYPPMANAPSYGGSYPPMANAPRHSATDSPMRNTPQHGSPYHQMVDAPTHGGSYPPMTNAPPQNAPYGPMTNAPQHGYPCPPMGNAPQYGDQYSSTTTMQHNVNKKPPMGQ